MSHNEGRKPLVKKSTFFGMLGGTCKTTTMSSRGPEDKVDGTSISPQNAGNAGTFTDTERISPL